MCNVIVSMNNSIIEILFNSLKYQICHVSLASRTYFCVYTNSDLKKYRCSVIQMLEDKTTTKDFDVFEEKKIYNIYNFHNHYIY